MKTILMKTILMKTILASPHVKLIAMLAIAAPHAAILGNPGTWH